MKNLDGFTIRWDEITSDMLINKKPVRMLYNFRYFSSTEGTSYDPIMVDDPAKLFDMLLNEIKDRDSKLLKIG